MTALPVSDPAISPSPDALRDAWLTTIDLLDRRRAGAVDPAFFDAYVRLGWLRWHGGSLRLTELGFAVCAEHSAALALTESSESP